MATAAAFDTHRFIQNLVKSGFTVQQAETLAYEQVDLLNSNLATTQDLDALRISLEAKLEEQRIAAAKEIETLRLAQDAKIDTLRISLEAKLEEQSRAIAENRNATSREFEALRLAHDAKLEELRHSHDAKLQSAKYDIIKWIYPAFVAQGGLIIAILKLFE